MYSQAYLLDKATEYAQKAVAADKAGDYETAIKYYKAAIDLFSKYLKFYPDAPMSDLYRDIVKKYIDRVRVLESKLETRIPEGGGSDNGKKTDESLFEISYPNQRETKKFDDLVDMDEVKKALKRAVIYPVKTPHLYPLGWPKGILLYGPPGCGKTEISIALANEINAVLINVSPATVVSKWLGDTEKNVKKIFDKAREIASSNTPVIVFIDEVDGLLQEYSNEVGGETRMRNQFLQEMDGLKSKGNEKLPLFVIGATNKPWNLDIGFIRRFEKRIYVPPPTKEVRKMLFEHYVKKLTGVFKIGEIDYDHLAEITENYSPHDIANIVKEVQNNVAEELNEKGLSNDRVITTEDFEAVIKVRKPSIDPKWLEYYKVWTEKFGTY